MRKIKLVCKEDEKIGDIACPSEEVYSDGSREINKRIDKFPVGAKLVFEVTSKLPMNPPTSVNYTAEVTVPAGMVDTNIRSNNAVVNTRIVGGRADVATTQFTPSISVEDMGMQVQTNDSLK